jgi:transposase
VERRVFPETFKREAVDRVGSSGLSAGAVTRELGLHETVLRRWIIQYGTQAPASSPSDLIAENTRLRRENDHLRMERGIKKEPHSSSERPPDEVRVHR